MSNKVTTCAVVATTKYLPELSNPSAVAAPRPTGTEAW